MTIRDAKVRRTAPLRTPSKLRFKRHRLHGYLALTLVQ